MILNSSAMIYGPMRQLGFAFIDIETTGINLDTSEIIEIGGLLVSPDFQIEEEFERKIKPEHIATAEPEALLINKYSEEGWRGADNLKDVLTAHWTRWEGRILAGWNVSFDSGRLEKAFLRCGLPDPFHYKRLDVPSIAFAKLFEIAEVKRFSLAEVAEYFGIEITNHHHALSDAKATYEVFLKLMKGDTTNKLF